ncbi:MAG: hypothetical protein ACP5HS_04160 [Anaerolineae bacterium]
MKSAQIWQYAISLLVILSLLLNVFLIVTLLNIEVGLRQAATAARTALSEAIDDPFSVSVKVDQEIPINATVPFSDTILVPVVFDFPFSAVVNTYVDLPVLGRQNIAVPVETTVPISETFEIPIEMSIPISMTYTLETEIPVRVEIPPELVASLNGFIDGFERGLRFSFR